MEYNEISRGNELKKNFNDYKQFEDQPLNREQGQDDTLSDVMGLLFSGLNGILASETNTMVPQPSDRRH